MAVICVTSSVFLLKKADLCCVCDVGYRSCRSMTRNATRVLKELPGSVNTEKTSYGCCFFMCNT